LLCIHANACGWRRRYIHTYIYTRTNTHPHTHTHMYTHIWIQWYLNGHTHTPIPTSKLLSVLQQFERIYIYSISIHIYTYVYICSHTHTHMYTHIWIQWYSNGQTHATIPTSKLISVLPQFERIYIYMIYVYIYIYINIHMC